MNFFSFINQDLSDNKNNTKGKIISVLFRIGNYCIDRPILKILMVPYLLFYKVFVEWILCIEIPFNTKVGKGLKILHGQGLVINSNTIIGKNVSFKQNTTIGNAKSGGKCPIFFNNINVGANCVIIGDITIGDNCVIGAGSVVIRDVPPNSVVVGNPAHVIKQSN